MSKQQACIAFWLRAQAARAAQKGDTAIATKASLALYLVEKQRLAIVVVR